MTNAAINTNSQLKAFRDTIAFAEGTDKPSVQPSRFNGYDVIVGGGLFLNFADHPRVLVPLPKLGIKSSAAGRYQFLRATWDSLKSRLRLTDFSPPSQDKACDELLRECGATPLLAQGKFEAALAASNKLWASLPGAQYGQRTEKVANLRAIFVKAGGVIR